MRKPNQGQLTAVEMGHVQTTSECGLKYTVWHFAPTTSRTEMSYSHSQSVYSNLRHSNEGQLTAVKLEHPVTIITLLYRGFIFLPIEVTYFLKFSADILFDHGLNSVF